MMTNSIILKYTFSMYNKFDYYYENSLSNKILTTLFFYLQNSKLTLFFYNLIFKKNDKNYRTSSIFLKFINLIFESIISWFKYIYSYINKLNNKSINNKIYSNNIAPLKKLSTSISLLSSLFLGLFSVLTIYYFLFTNSIKLTIIALCLSLIFLLLTFLKNEFIANTIDSSLLKKFIIWFFD